MELWPVQEQLSIEAQRIIAKRAYLRGLIRNNSTLITVMTGDLTIYVGRLPANKGTLVRKDVNWFIANVEELGKRIEASFSRETENTTEKKYIRFRPGPQALLITFHLKLRLRMILTRLLRSLEMS